MRVDSDTSIHDLTDDEAADLRRLCEAMLRGEMSRHGNGIKEHPLFVAWLAAAPFPTPAANFLPRALHALLRRAETMARRPSGLHDAVSRVLRAKQGSSGGGYPCGPYWVDEWDMDALRKAYGQ